jgi:hypothetical protein
MLEVLKLIRGMDPAGLLFISVIGFALERRQRKFGEELASVKAVLEVLVNGHRMRGRDDRTTSRFYRDR